MSKYEVYYDFEIKFANNHYIVTKYTGIDEVVMIPFVVGDEEVKVIGEGSFHCCENLKILLMPDCIIKISKKAFENCKNLTGILTIPKSVIEINEYAFWGCENLEKVYVEADKNHIEIHPNAFPKHTKITFIKRKGN
jgi:hypothetical protein